MKKNMKINLACVSFGVFILITACNSNINNMQKEIEIQEDDKYSEIDSETKKETGSASFNLVVPDYYAMAGLEHARAIAPQTSKIKFSYKENKDSTEWIVHSTIELSQAEKTEIPNAPEGFAGSMYKCSFQNVPSGKYYIGTLKMDLLDSENNIISSGINDDIVDIKVGEITHTIFYTIPTSIDSNAGSLAAGEMKFFKKEFLNLDCILTISVIGEGAYPDLVIFKENGTFEEYIRISAGNKDIDCKDYRGKTKYLGFWSPTATSYSTIIRFNYETAFDNILNNPDWTKSNKNAITEENRVITFDGKEQEGSIKRKIFLNEAKSFSFKVQTNLYEQYDGSLQFLIDDVLMASYTGKNSIVNALFEIDAGVHTIEWKRDDISSSYTSDMEQFVSIYDFAFGEPIQALETINQDFETDLDSNMWLEAGLLSKVVFADTHGYAYKLGVHKDSIAGNSSLTIYKITLAEEKMLSFDYKLDLVNGEHNDYFRIYIDNFEIPVFEITGSEKTWDKGTILLTAGTHSIKFSAEKTYYDGRYWYKKNGENAVFIDNIILEANNDNSM